MRCCLRAEVNECLRWFPDVELSGTSGFHGHQRIFLDVGVGSFKQLHRVRPYLTETVSEGPYPVM
jgi:hypothetical protein